MIVGLWDRDNLCAQNVAQWTKLGEKHLKSRKNHKTNISVYDFKLLIVDEVGHLVRKPIPSFRNQTCNCEI